MGHDYLYRSSSDCAGESSFDHKSVDKVDLDSNTGFIPLLAWLGTFVRDHCTGNWIFHRVLWHESAPLWQLDILGNDSPFTYILFAKRLCLEVHQANVLSGLVSPHSGNPEVQRRRLQTSYGTIPEGN